VSAAHPAAATQLNIIRGFKELRQKQSTTKLSDCRSDLLNGQTDIKTFYRRSEDCKQLEVMRCSKSTTSAAKAILPTLPKMPQPIYRKTFCMV